MTPRHSPTRAAVVLLCLGIVAGIGMSAQAADDPAAAMRRTRIERLEAEVAAIEARRAGRLTEVRAAEIRSLVADVLADADLRASRLSDEFLGGHDGDFFIGSADGTFRLEMSGQIQTRFISNRRNTGTENETVSGFEVRRAKIKFDGHIVNRDIGFTIGTSFDDADGEMILQTFNIRYRLSPEWRVFLGRSRPPLLREEQVSSKRQLAVERSLVAKTFDQSRTIGIKLQYQNDWFQFDGGAMDARTDLTSEDNRWRLSARVAALLSGEWKRLSDFTSFPDDEATVAIGAGVFFQTEDLVDPTQNEVELFRWSADVTIEFGGANFLAYFVSSRQTQETVQARDQYGWVAQGGYFFSDDWEIFGRYEAGSADGAAPDLSVVTVGVNRYLREHALKLTLDVGYGLKRLDSFWTSTGAAWLEDDAGEDGQVVTRVQFQLLF